MPLNPVAHIRNMIRYLFLLPTFAALVLPIHAQQPSFSGVSTRWNDSFVEWETYCFDPDTSAAADEAPEEYTCGNLQLRWLNLKEDWTDWDFQLGDLRGSIRRKWKDDPTHWELRAFDGSVITMRAAWANDLNEWRVTDNNISLSLRSRWGNQLDEWIVDDRARGQFHLYTTHRNDPRDWTIEDGLSENIPQTMKLALIFLAIYHASPKQ